MVRTPSSLRRLCRDVLPVLHRGASGTRAISSVRKIVDTERWNSFDRFHHTTRTLSALYDRAGAQVEVESIRTGQGIGTGRWVIHEANDIRTATARVIHPVQVGFLDYRKNPWHVVQWSAATPQCGLTGALVVVDDPKHLNELEAGALREKFVLTRLDPRPHLRRLVDLGALGVFTDRPVPNHPNAVAWTKFGWGGIPLEAGPARLVGLVVSGTQGRRLRDLAVRHGRLTVRATVDIRRYVGTHDVVSGTVRGRQDPQSEVWALAHGAEPGAIDNASGIAVCIEIARVLEQLIGRRKLERPRRSIRLLHGYECYGFFGYLQEVERFGPPLAGVDLDSVGARPEVCDGRLEWHATIPMSAGFVDRVGLRIVREALRLDPPGYRCAYEPFVSTSDTLIGDPKYGFPCPWLTTHRGMDRGVFDAYHSSADTVGLLSARGLRLCAASMAAYLYYLADAGSDEVCDLASRETAHFLPRVRAASGPQAAFLAEQHRVSIDRLKRWIWGGDRQAILAHLDHCEHEVAGAHCAHRVAPGSGRGSQVPRRTAALSPMLENTPPSIAKRIRDSRLEAWALYWADGARTLADIAQAITCETGKPATLEQVSEFFEAHADLGYVQMIEGKNLVSRSRLVRDLKALGLKRGMDVMVHSSLSMIGHVAGGPDGVVDALLRVLGKTGTLLMPSFNHREAKVFNPRTTPTVNGAVPDAMWRRPEARRSLHPTHAVTAIGPRGEEYCRDHIEVGVWAENSPIGRLVHGGGHILSLGVTHEATTAYHVAEISVPCRCIDQFGIRDRVVLADGEVHDVPGLAFRAWPCPVSPGKLDDVLDRRNLQRRGKVGNADAMLVKAIDLYRVRVEHLKPVCPTCSVRPQMRP